MSDVTDHPSRRFAAVLALALLVAACGGNGEAARANPSSTTTTTTAEPPPSVGLPGERVEIYPYQGARLAVVGVAADDTLKVRSGPGTGFDVVLELDPLATNATATGHNRSIPDAGFWAEITVDGRTGWARAAFLLQPGLVSDITARLFPAAADRPAAETMQALGRMVAERVASDEPPSDIVVVDEPDAGDRAEITVDVIGFGDDSVGGERLRISADRAPDGDGFRLRAVGSTALCTRGVSDGGLCT